MKLEEELLNCQIPCLQHVAEGIAEGPAQSFSRRCKLLLRRHLNPAKERTLKNYTNDCINRFCTITGRRTKPSISVKRIPTAAFRAGDWVRVRSRDEIENTLNHWRQVRGCAFMSEMAEYCGTVKRVFKTMERFVDERDLKIKKSKGIILLEGVMCKGTAEFGSCDRSCLHFWREEWLEKHEGEPTSATDVSAAPRLGDDFVRVRPLEAIESTLDRNRRHRGCTFLPEMAQYCGTVHRVLKPLSRYVDERDLRVKKSDGIVLLEGIMCQGAAESGHCDRSCPVLWREEWLERIDTTQGVSDPLKE